MMLDMHVPWLSLSGQEGEVLHSLKAMDISPMDGPANVDMHSDLSMSTKHKRSQSPVSPPKVSFGKFCG
jgi:hypothetical protein